MDYPTKFTVLNDNTATIHSALKFLSKVEVFRTGTPEPILMCQHCGYKGYLYIVLPEHHSSVTQMLTNAQRRGNFIWEPEEVDLGDRTVSWKERVIVGAILELSIEQGLDVTIDIVEHEEFDDFGNEFLTNCVEVTLKQDDEKLHVFSMDESKVNHHSFHNGKYMQTATIPCLPLALEADTKKYLDHLIELRDKLSYTHL